MPGNFQGWGVGIRHVGHCSLQVKVSGGQVRTCCTSLTFRSVQDLIFALGLVYGMFQSPVVRFVCRECAEVDLSVIRSQVRTYHIFDFMQAFFFALGFVHDMFQSPVVRFVCSECAEVDLPVTRSQVRTYRILINFDFMQAFFFDLGFVYDTFQSPVIRFVNALRLTFQSPGLR
jgi:hypothetical protein